MAKTRFSASLGILALAAIAALVLHLLAGTTFPNPWPDEIDFLTPAAQLARHFTLDAPQLAAPHGMLWEPDLMYVLWAPILRFAPLAVVSARWLSLALMVAAAGGFFDTGRRAGVPAVAAAAASGLWLLTPEAIAAGNIARPEAMVLAFIAWATAATFADRRVLALSLAALACLSHSAGVPFAVVIAAANLLRGASRRARQAPTVRRGEWVFAGVVAALVALQTLHLLLRFSVAREQLRFQAEVHSHVSHGNRLPYILPAVIMTLALVLLRRRLDWRAITLGALAVVGLAVLFIGWEFWYDVYATATAPLLVAFVAIVALRPLVSTAQIARLATALVVVLFAIVTIPPTTHPRFEGLEFRRHPDEWPAFERRVRAELTRIDNSVAGPRIVVFNDVSGLPWPLLTDRYGAHLRLVKETLVTRLSVKAQYAVFIPRHRPVPHGRVLARVTSPHRYFTAIVVELSAT